MDYTTERKVRARLGNALEKITEAKAMLLNSENDLAVLYQLDIIIKLISNTSDYMYYTREVSKK